MGFFSPLCYPNAICASALKCELPLEASFLLTSHMLRAYIWTASPFTSYRYFSVAPASPGGADTVERSSL